MPNKDNQVLQDTTKAINATILRAKLLDTIMTGVFYVVALFFLVLLIVFATYIIVKGFMDFDISMMAFDHRGIGNQLFNTVYLVILALLISVPLGLLSGIYMAEYAKPGRVTRIIRISIETLSSLPSIVVGLFGYLVFIVMTGSQWNLFAGALAVSILSLPIISTTTEDALKSLPDGYKKGSYGMGATKWQTIRMVLLPACIPQIMTGIILAAGRAFGEAAALMFTAGMSTDINWNSTNLFSSTHPLNPFRPGETLALQIWASRTEAIAENSTQIANLCAAILMIMVFTFSISARYISQHINKKMIGDHK